jgi:hypothetical protein
MMTIQGRIQDFKLEGAHLKIVGVFRVKKSRYPCLGKVSENLNFGVGYQGINPSESKFIGLWSEVDENQH